jgi:hypothetical protein
VNSGKISRQSRHLKQENIQFLRAPSTGLMVTVSHALGRESYFALVRMMESEDSPLGDD